MNVTPADEAFRKLGSYLLSHKQLGSCCHKFCVTQSMLARCKRTALRNIGLYEVISTACSGQPRTEVQKADLPGELTRRVLSNCHGLTCRAAPTQPAPLTPLRLSLESLRSKTRSTPVAYRAGAHRC